jgi:hypothetical protein
MDAVVKEKWVAALRSGEYKQTKGELVKVSGDGSQSYCCLGVLCDLAVKEGVISESLFVDGYLATPGPEVVKWAGMESKNPEVSTSVVDGFLHPSVAEVNDFSEVGFAGIADLIEEQL